MPTRMRVGDDVASTGVSHAVHHRPYGILHSLGETASKGAATLVFGDSSSHFPPHRHPLLTGYRRSRPNDRGVILIPGGAWRRLNSLPSIQL
jgi:hypothetical protein